MNVQALAIAQTPPAWLAKSTCKAIERHNAAVVDLGRRLEALRLEVERLTDDEEFGGNVATAFPAAAAGQSEAVAILGEIVAAVRRVAALEAMYVADLEAEAARLETVLSGTAQKIKDHLVAGGLPAGPDVVFRLAGPDHHAGASKLAAIRQDLANLAASGAGPFQSHERSQIERQAVAVLAGALRAAMPAACGLCG